MARSPRRLSPLAEMASWASSCRVSGALCTVGLAFAAEARTPEHPYRPELETPTLHARLRIRRAYETTYDDIRFRTAFSRLAVPDGLHCTAQSADCLVRCPGTTACLQ